MCLVVVLTPFKNNHEPDISYVESATNDIIPLLKKGDLYIIESTSPVGTIKKMKELIFKKRPELEGTYILLIALREFYPVMLCMNLFTMTE